MSASEGLADLADRLAIMDLFAEFADRVDAKDWQGYASLYDPQDGKLIVPWREPIPQADIAAVAEAALGKWLRTHHMITNHHIVVTSDRAQSRCYVHAVHLRSDDPGDAWVLGGRYDCVHKRVGGSWRFETLALTHFWQRGQNPNVVADATPLAE
jgi:3-phenylpropionate/cinnamic acid dioxygenase small subunit